MIDIQYALCKKMLFYLYCKFGFQRPKYELLSFSLKIFLYFYDNNLTKFSKGTAPVCQQALGNWKFYNPVGLFCVWETFFNQGPQLGIMEVYHMIIYFPKPL